MARYLLDTNVLLGFVRGAEWARRAHEKFELADSDAVVLTSDVCRGELLSLAEQFGWGADKRGKMEQALDNYASVGISDRTIQERYALIDAWTHRRLQRARRDLPKMPDTATPMKQNDLWIAATASVLRAALLSTDTDFLHLDPAFLEVHTIDQTQ